MGDQGPSTSRRHLLAVGAASLGVGATAGYATASTIYTNEQPTCDPHERLFDPDDWPAPRYDPAGTARAPARNAPKGELEEIWHAEWSPTEQIGQPVISAGRVAVATRRGGRKSIVTLDLATGDVLWDERVSDRLEVGSLVAAGGDLFYRTGLEDIGRGVLVLSLRDGTHRWSEPQDWNPRMGPVVTEQGHVWITDRNARDKASSVVALSADTGADCSSWQIDGMALGAARVGERHVYQGTREGAVALDLESGEELWRTDEARSPSVVSGDKMYATGTFGWLSVHDIESGDAEWTVESEHYLDGEPHPDNPDRMVDGAGVAYARPDYRSLALADDVLLSRERVFSDHPDRIIAFDAEDGSELWQLAPEDEWPNPDDRFWYTGPVVAGESAIICENRRVGNSYLSEIDIQSGTVTDRTEMDAPALHAPAVGRGAIVVPRIDGIACYGDNS